MKLLIKFLYLTFLKFCCSKCYKTRGTHVPILLRYLFWQKILGFNRNTYWPVHFTSIVTHPENICIGVDTSPGFMPGCYIQGIGSIYIGDYTQISANVGIISSNHNIYDTRKHERSEVKIGRYCWIGMNSVILPGVTLGDHVIVGAGSIVTKSFTSGYVIIAGNPAKIIRELTREECIAYKHPYEFNGYIESNKFNFYRKKKLNV